MIKNYKNSIAALFDEGYEVADLHDLLDAAKAEYDKAHKVALVNELLAVFKAYDVPMKVEPLSKFVNMSAGELENFVNQNSTVANCSKHETEKTDTCSEMRTAQAKTPNGFVKVKTNCGDPDEIIKDWMKTLGF